jgi:hypothetical protein
MIVKIQIPLITNGQDPQALIYNQYRDIRVEVPVGQVLPLFDKGEFKIYHHATLDNLNWLVIGNRAPDQSW